MVQTHVAKTEASVTNSLQILNIEAPWSNVHKNGGIYHRNSVATPTATSLMLSSASNNGGIVQTSMSELCQKYVETATSWN